MAKSRTSWTKGKTGNPKGRTPNHVNLTTALKAEIERIVPGDQQNRTWTQLLVLATLKLALQGHPVALKEVWDRVDGKVTQGLELHLHMHQEIEARLLRARESAAQRQLHVTNASE